MFIKARSPNWGRTGVCSLLIVVGRPGGSLAEASILMNPSGTVKTSAEDFNPGLYLFPLCGMLVHTVNPENLPTISTPAFYLYCPRSYQRIDYDELIALVGFSGIWTETTEGGESFGLAPVIRVDNSYNVHEERP